MSRAYGSFFLLLTLLAIGRADEGVREVVLEFSGKPIPTQEWAGALMGNIECDDSGGIYFRRAGGAPGTGSALEQPVVRIDSTGQVTEFKLAAVPGVPKDAVVFVHSIDRWGSVFVLSQWTDERKATRLHVIKFGKNGAFAGTTVLRPADVTSLLFPHSLHVTPHGEILIVAGSLLSSDLRTPFQTLIFSSNGELRKIVASEQKVGTADASVVFSAHSVLDENGQLYILQPTARIDVLDAHGRPLKRIPLSAPFAGARPDRILFAGARLLIRFQERPNQDDKGHLPKVVYTLYDAETAEPLVSYVVPPRSGILACADPQRLTFLRPGDDGRFAIVHAPLK